MTVYSKSVSHDETATYAHVIRAQFDKHSYAYADYSYFYKNIVFIKYFINNINILKKDKNYP